MRCIGMVIAAALAAGLAGLTGSASAQDALRLERDLPRNAQPLAAPRLQLEEQGRNQAGQTPQFSGPAGYQFNPDTELWYGWVNFGVDRRRGIVEGADLENAYREDAGGVRFGLGQRGQSSLVRCGAGSNTCPASDPDSPEALRGPGQGAIRIDFARPVLAVAALVAPDRSVGRGPEIVIMEGWSDGERVQSVQEPVQGFDDAGNGWTRLTLSGLAANSRAAATNAAPSAEAARAFDYVIIRGVNGNGGPVATPLVLDELRFADRDGPAAFDSLGPRSGGLTSLLEATRRAAPRLAEGAQVVREGGREETMQYPVAQRVRLAVDLSLARDGAAGQRTQTQLAVPLTARLDGRERTTIPILAPLGVFAGEDPGAGLVEGARFMGRENFFHLRFDTPHGPAVISGTRIAVIEPRDTRTPGDLQLSSGYDGAYASFNLFGASYSVRLSCDLESRGQPCNDAAALETLLERLFVFLPDGER